MGSTVKICLASVSPRRQELLHQIGIDFIAEGSGIDESISGKESPEQYVSRMAFEKADTVFDRRVKQDKDHLPVLGADTAVVIDNQILGKPANRTEASEMLAQLSGRTHEVFTAISLASKANKQLRALNISKVTFCKVSQQEITYYIESGEADDKAGGYGIQGRAAAFVSRLEGSYSAVVGLPLYELSELLKKYEHSL